MIYLKKEELAKLVAKQAKENGARRRVFAILTDAEFVPTPFLKGKFATNAACA